MSRRDAQDDGNQGANLVECAICAKWRLSTDMREQESQGRGIGRTDLWVCSDTCYSPYHPQNDKGDIDTEERQPDIKRPVSETGDGPGTAPTALDIVWTP